MKTFRIDLQKELNIDNEMQRLIDWNEKVKLQFSALLDSEDFFNQMGVGKLSKKEKNEHFRKMPLTLSAGALGDILESFANLAKEINDLKNNQKFYLKKY